MAQSKFTLYKYIKLDDGSWRYKRAAFYSNSKIKPKIRSEVGGLKSCVRGMREDKYPRMKLPLEWSSKMKKINIQANNRLNRRTFIGVTAAGIAGAGMAADAKSIPIIDTHIHLFDPRRPQGIPWPEKSDTVLYQPALPSRYRKVTEGLGIVGAIELECSPWLEDNQWVLDIAAKDTIIVGTVGDLEPGQPDFRKNLERFHRNPLFRGIRCGNLWDRDLSKQVSDPQFISDLRGLADAGLVLDTANPDAALIAAVVRLTEQVPSLRVVIDHLPQMDPPAESQARSLVRANLQELGKRPQVYVKVSEVLRLVGGQVPYATSFYRDRLDEIWELFGPDRLLFGSDWPNSDLCGTYPQVVKIVREYFLSKGRAAAEKYFWKNSIAAYCWVKREKSQPQLLPG